jgi:transposase
MTACEQCEAMSKGLELARSRNVILEEQVAQLESERTSLRAQLAEALKLCQLQKADLDRYDKAYQARPNHPERAPSDLLQLAFERVLETLGVKPAANDAKDESKPGAGTEQQEAPRGKHNKKQKRRHAHGRRPLDLTNLPVIEQRIEPEQVLASLGQGYEYIGDEVSERIARREAQYVRYRIIRPKYVAILASPAEAVVEPNDEPSKNAPSDAEANAAVDVAHDGNSDATAAEEATVDDPQCADSADAEPAVRIVIAPLPDGVWPKVMADTSAIAHIITSKYGDLLPLNRQQNISERGGFVLPKSTQCGWLKPAAEYCAPVVDAMMDDACQHAFLIATDATSATVRPPKKDTDDARGSSVERRRCEPWHVFVFIADRDHVVFRYDREHTGAVFQRMLRGYRGNLLADAASVFDVLYREHGITEHCCWSHARRPFYRALETDPQRALEPLSIIGKLFEVDRNLRAEQLTLDEITRARAEQARPILKLLDDWVGVNRSHVDPRGPLDAAIRYYENQREGLHRFLKDGRIRLDNNLCEQALRNLVVGEANWVFFANETGIKWYTTFRSLIASCMLHRLNPEIYLEQLLRIVPHWPKHRVLELSPKYWLQTVEKLDGKWRTILARPWEPGVLLSAEISPTRRESGVSAECAA